MNEVLTQKRIEKIFPDYFERFELPAGAKEESIQVYRACRSGKCDKASFMNKMDINYNLCFRQMILGNIHYQYMKSLHMLNDLHPWTQICMCPLKLQ